MLLKWLRYGKVDWVAGQGVGGCDMGADAMTSIGESVRG